MLLGFTPQTLGATYVRLLLAGVHSPLSIALPSVSLHISAATKRVKLLNRIHVTLCPGAGGGSYT